MKLQKHNNQEKYKSTEIEQLKIEGPNRIKNQIE
jgi:hypothetical protein